MVIKKLNWTKSHCVFRYKSGITCLIICLIVLLLPVKQIHAATGAIDPNGDGTIGSNWVATPSGSRYTTIDDAVRQPTTPTTSDYISIGSNRADTAFFQMSTLGSVGVVSSITLWVYHNDGANGTIFASLYDNAETTTYGTEQTLTSRTTDTWDSVTFSGLTLTQSNLDDLRIKFRVTKGAGAASTVKIYATYGDVTYTSGILSVDIVDGSGNSVTSPAISLSALNASFSCQTSTGTLGTSSQKIRVNNTTANGNWTLSIAATNGATASWSNGSNSYDFNDSSGTPAGCSDGGDADTRAGQLTIDPSAGTITPQTLCSSTGVSKGTSTAFTEGTTNNINLMSASGSQIACYYDLTGISLSQKVPGELPASGTAYTINMTLTITAN